ncbi:hypothetical protein HCU74_08000 [Spongiibacter sp. KMU-166]|uniref:Secreted protein n=1 Tax=Spongiibacter thalassae TaxID=2721624 RepID=A0ABX1GEL3_9GAMM|nr:hypothetical protein [Spongiibacter thalassae]NKI17356.1 hypothetical protein [Spongiibacter thalassae]
MMMRTLVLLLAMASGNVAADDEAGDALPVVKLGPQLRIVDADYSAVPCEQLHLIQPQSPGEKARLAQRKQQCVERYRQFIPEKGLR